MPNSSGIQPCTELETRAGIWRYNANRTGQRFSPAERFATGHVSLDQWMALTRRAMVLVLLHDAEDAGWRLASRSSARHRRAQDPAVGRRIFI
jgi:hypothetical protein